MRQHLIPDPVPEGSTQNAPRPTVTGGSRGVAVVPRAVRRRSGQRRMTPRAIRFPIS